MKGWTTEDVKSSLADALKTLYIESSTVCCGAGRHMIVFVIDEAGGKLEYMHDSAVCRGGNPRETGEDRVVYAERCSSCEHALDYVDNAREWIEEAGGDFRAACRDYALETVSSWCDDDVLEHYNIDNFDIEDITEQINDLITEEEDE